MDEPRSKELVCCSATKLCLTYPLSILLDKFCFMGDKVRCYCKFNELDLERLMSSAWIVGK